MLRPARSHQFKASDGTNLLWPMVGCTQHFGSAGVEMPLPVREYLHRAQSWHQPRNDFAMLEIFASAVKQFSKGLPAEGRAVGLRPNAYLGSRPPPSPAAAESDGRRSRREAQLVDNYLNGRRMA
jgi:hypothetical protein